MTNYPTRRNYQAGKATPVAEWVAKPWSSVEILCYKEIDIADLLPVRPKAAEWLADHYGPSYLAKVYIEVADDESVNYHGQVLTEVLPLDDEFVAALDACPWLSGEDVRTLDDLLTEFCENLPVEQFEEWED